MDDEAIPRRWLTFLLQLTPRPIRNAVVGAILLLIVVALAAWAIDFVAGDDPAAERLKTRLKQALMVMAFLVAVTCAAAYVRYVISPDDAPGSRDGN